MKWAVIANRFLSLLSPGGHLSILCLGWESDLVQKERDHLQSQREASEAFRSGVVWVWRRNEKLGRPKCSISSCTGVWTARLWSKCQREEPCSLQCWGNKDPSMGASASGSPVTCFSRQAPGWSCLGENAGNPESPADLQGEGVWHLPVSLWGGCKGMPRK